VCRLTKTHLAPLQRTTYTTSYINTVLCCAVLVNLLWSKHIVLHFFPSFPVLDCHPLSYSHPSSHLLPTNLFSLFLITNTLSKPNTPSPTKQTPFHQSSIPLQYPTDTRHHTSLRSNGPHRGQGKIVLIFPRSILIVSICR
jgi:hypothetical protein